MTGSKSTCYRIDLLNCVCFNDFEFLFIDIDLLFFFIFKAYPMKKNHSKKLNCQYNNLNNLI